MLSQDRQKIMYIINIIDKIRINIPDQDINNITYEKHKYIQNCYDCVDTLKNILAEDY